MADCKYLKGCPFFNDRMPDDSGLGAMYKRKYCQGDNSDCARYRVVTTLGPPSVPIDLYPNMVDRADAIIAGN